MRSSVRYLVGLLVSAFVLAGVPANSAMAQDKAKGAKGAPVVKVLLENDKVRVTETTYKPGDASASRERVPRLSYTPKGGMSERGNPDGKKVKREVKAGEWRWYGEKETYSVTNVGKTTIVYIGILYK